MEEALRSLTASPGVFEIAIALGGFLVVQAIAHALRR